jgi:hypothetical protein
MKRREPAWRVFAGEYNDSTVEIRGGEKTPSYIVTPLGGKINRLFLVGVLTDVENVSEGGEFLRAHVSDPTGVFTLYSGQYQKDATDQLLNIEVPSFIGVIGKIRTFVPEEGSMYLSIRPEVVRELDVEARNRWIIETCVQTKHRIGAIIEGMKMNPPNVYDLRKLGYSRDLSEGVVTALKNYGEIDIEKYLSLIRESLHYITPQEWKRKMGSEEIENLILETIKEVEGDEGAAWDLIVEKCQKKGIDENTIEEALTSLMDKGYIFEPVLGTIKST